MRFVFSNLPLLIALGACFKFTDAQETTEADANATTNTIANNNAVDSTLSSEITNATPENTAAVLPTVVHPQNSETTLVNQISTMPEEQTVASTPPLSTAIEQTSPEPSPEPTTAQAEHTTVASTTVPVIVETTVTEQIPSEAPSTSQHETTVGFTSPELTSPTEQSTEEITTAAVALTTVSTIAITAILPKPDSDESPTTTSDPVDTSTEPSTTTLTSITKQPPNFSEVHTTFSSAGVILEDSSSPWENSWLIIIIACMVTLLVLCVVIIVIIQRRKKNASRNFGPVHVNGQSKRSKKKKGAQDDAWAGPVNLEAGVECDAEAQDGLLPNDGKQDDDMVLSTFTAPDAGDVSNGGVGGDGTKEAKKWEEQEPLLYIDEDATENKAEKTLAENEKQKGDDKSEEKGMNGGEAFCLTTAV
ncbi:hypothetical protein M9458_006268 [Cirrhinus mrigala]|uniref:Uncharacterized protein n=1 Tax=Cirrhinus mrigala TaxID=683832 RepID=A0ABD0RH94_CIRMR